MDDRDGSKLTATPPRLGKICPAFKWTSIIAAALTVAVWVAYAVQFPDNRLNIGETVVVLILTSVLCCGVTMIFRLLRYLLR